MCNTIMVMLVPEKGNRRFTFKLSYRVFSSIAALLILILFFSVFSFLKYMSIYRENLSFQNQICQLEKNFNESRDINNEASEYRNWSSKIIADKLSYEEISGRGNMRPSANVLDGEIRDKTMKYSSILNARQLDIRRTNLHMDFNASFSLINRTKNHHELSGYIFVVASNNEVVPPVYTSWPSTKIIAGIPEDYTLGSPFSIRYMKVVRGILNQPDIGPKFNRIDIIAYSENGKVLLKRGYYIEKMLQENPFE